MAFVICKNSHMELPLCGVVLASYYFSEKSLLRCMLTGISLTTPLW